jgi:hypothetical protein
MGWDGVVVVINIVADCEQDDRWETGGDDELGEIARREENRWCGIVSE